MNLNRTAIVISGVGAALAALLWLLASGAAQPNSATAPHTAAEHRTAAPEPVAASAAIDQPQRHEIGSVAYDFSMTWLQTMEIRSEAGPTVQSCERELRGVMQWTPLRDVTDSNNLQVLRFADLVASGELDGRQIEDEELVAQLAHPMLVRVDERGSVLGYRFASELQVDNRDLIRSLVSNGRFVAPPTAAARDWAANETDPTGPYRARYSRVTQGDGSHVVRKTKPLTAEAGSDPSSLVQRIASDAEARFAAIEDRHYLSAHASERLVANIPEIGAKVTVAFRAEWTLGDGSAFADALPVPSAMLAASGWATLDGADEEDLSDDLAFEEEDPITVGEASATLGGILSGDDVDPLTRLELLERLAAQVGRDPDILRELGLWIDEAQDERVASFVLGSVGAADTPAAGEFLAERLSDPLRPPADRMHAAIAASQLSRPGPKVFGALRSLSRDPAVPRGVRNSSLLALASASRSANPDDDSAAAATAVLDHEEEARRRGELPTWFDALANLGSDAALTKLEAYAQHSDPSLRTAAVRATARVALPRATEIVFARRGDSSPRVRAEVSFCIGRRLNEFGEHAESILTDDADESVRAAAINGLARSDDESGRARRLLTHFAGRDPSETLRSAAARALEGN